MHLLVGALAETLWVVGLCRECCTDADSQRPNHPENESELLVGRLRVIRPFMSALTVLLCGLLTH